MADLIQISILIMGAVSVPLYVTYLGEFRTFPFFPHTQRNEIYTAHMMRLLSVLATGITVSYSLALLGHLVGLGGFETMFYGERFDVFFIIGVAGVIFSAFSKHLDNKIYKIIQEYDDLLDEDFKAVKIKIRKEGLIREKLQQTTEEKEERAVQKEHELDELMLKIYKLDQRSEEAETQLRIAIKRMNEAEKQEEKAKLAIKVTEAEIDVAEKLISLTEPKTAKLEVELTKLKKAFVVKLNLLHPLQEKHKGQKKELSKKGTEFKNLDELIHETKRSIAHYNKEITKVEQKSKNAEKKLAELDYEDAESARKAIAVRKRLNTLITQKKAFEKVINEREIQRLADEDELIAIEMLRKSIEKAFEDEKPPQGGRIFED